MANKKISELTALTSPAATDVLPIIDQSESAASDKNKKIAYSDLLSKAPDGTELLPSIAFLSDPDTGIASAGSNAIRIVTGGSSRIIADTNGLVTIPGSLTVKGTTTTINSVDVSTKDRNIHLGKVASASVTGNIAAGAATITGLSATDNLAPGVIVTLSSGGGSVTLGSGIKVLTVDSTTQVTLDTNFGGSGTATGATLAAGGPTNASADGGGLTIEAGSDTDKTFNWVSSTSSWTSSENLNLASGKVLKVAGTQVLSATAYTGNAATATALATARAINGVNFDGTAAITVTAAAGTLTGTELKSTVVTSSLTSVGTLTSLASGAITTTDNLSVDNAKEVRLYEADSNGSAYIGIKGATDKGSEASYTVSLPAAAPTANQILKANSSTPTNLEWATDSGGIPTSGGTFTGKVTHNYTSSLRVPVGSTGQRDGSPSNGDFRYNSTTSKFEGYQGGSWGEIGGGATGTADLLDIASSSGSGGGGATFDGSRYRFKLVTKGTSDAVTPTNAEILRVSINGVIQQPNDGTGQGDMTEGYVVDGTDIVFDSAPPSGASYFIINMGTTIAIGTPGDTTVTEAKLNVSNGPTNGYFLQAQSGAAGGLTWAEVTTTPTTTRGDIIYRGASADQRLAKGTSGQFLKIGANDPEWADVVGAVADGCIYENSQTITNDYTIDSGKGAHSVGPITANGTVTVNGVWLIS